jgi:hypothetical protein
MAVGEARPALKDEGRATQLNSFRALLKSAGRRAALRGGIVSRFSAA